MLVWYRLQKNLIIEKTFLWKWNSVTTLPGKIVTQISIAVFLRILATWFVLHIVQPSILTLRVEQYSLLSCSTVLYILFPPPPTSPWVTHGNNTITELIFGAGIARLASRHFHYSFFWAKNGENALYCTLHMEAQKRWCYIKSWVVMNCAILSSANRVQGCVACLRHFFFLHQSLLGEGCPGIFGDPS